MFLSSCLVLLSSTVIANEIHIDFNNGSGSLRNQYERYGIIFDSEGIGDRMPTHSTGYESSTPYARCSVTTYPPGFNIVAHFTVDVEGVSADVQTAYGRYVTMRAFNEAGDLIEEKESPAVPDGFWKGRLSIESEEPIARVEWWPSLDNASVGIDDLVIITDHIVVGPPNGSTTVPTLSMTGIMSLVMTMMAIAIYMRRKSENRSSA